LRIAAEILKGNKVHEAVRFIVSPATQQIYLQASRAGYLEILVEAGAQILPPTCDVCVGVQAPLSDGDVGLSQQTLNVPGRSGSVKADIYLAGAATIAVSSLHGRIMDPTEFFTRLQETEGGSV
jgi:3-isopropylmalate/(R)-2-methylmalate dehydratase large subunit